MNNLFLVNPVASDVFLVDENNIVHCSDIKPCPYVGCSWKLLSGDLDIWSFHQWDEHAAVDWQHHLSCKFSPHCSKLFKTKAKRDQHETSCSWLRKPCHRDFCTFYGGYHEFRLSLHDMCSDEIDECGYCGERFNDPDALDDHQCKKRRRHEDQAVDGIRVTDANGTVQV